MKVNKDKLTFKNNFLKTEKGRDAQKHGDYYKQIKASIEKHGIINPLICIQDGDMYKICLGIKRFIIGCDLGIQEFNIKVLPNDNVELLKEENLKYKPTDADNAYFKFTKQK
jgi:ParB-like chromosome segregation protein Spo0J